MTEMTVDLGGENSLWTVEGKAVLDLEDGSSFTFDLEGLGLVSEWLAVAWENVAGEAYQPIQVSPNGYVSDPGQVIMVTLDTANEIAESVAERIASHRIGTYSIAERDCE